MYSADPIGKRASCGETSTASQNERYGLHGDQLKLLRYLLRSPTQIGRAAALAALLAAGPAVLGLLLTCCVAPVEAASDALSIDFIAPEQDGASSANWSIFLDGLIDEGAAERLRDELERRDIASARVYLNSPGGILQQGMALGRIIRQRGFSTYVGRTRESAGDVLPGGCSSACVFAFIGGVYRFAPPQSRIGVHRFSSMASGDADPDTVQMVSAAIVRYIREMGVDVDLFERMTRRGKDQILILSEKDVRELRVVNAGRLPAQWSIEATDGALQLNGAQRTSSGMAAVSLSCRNGRVLFRPIVSLGENAAEVDSVIRHSIKFGSWTEPLGDSVEPLSVRDGQASALFALGQEQVNRLRGSASIGYAAQSRDLTTFANFSVDTGGGDKIREFLQNCTD